jgi:hypothetical protein
MALGQYNASPTRTHYVSSQRRSSLPSGDYRPLLDTRHGPTLSYRHLSRVFPCAVASQTLIGQPTRKDRRSISGYCFYFLNSLVSWLATKQKTVSLSSTESEYYAMTHAMKEALWIRLFLTIHRLPVPRSFPPSLRQPKRPRPY